jgi:transposase
VSRKYPVEFRRKVLDLIEAGKPVAEIAAQLGITAQTVHNWRNQDQIDRGLRGGTSTSESAALASVNKRIRELETELAVTKRANELLKGQTDPKAVGGRRAGYERGPPDRGDVSRGWRVGVGFLHVASPSTVSAIGSPRDGC